MWNVAPLNPVTCNLKDQIGSQCVIVLCRIGPWVASRPSRRDTETQRPSRTYFSVQYNNTEDATVQTVMDDVLMYECR